MSRAGFQPSSFCGTVLLRLMLDVEVDCFVDVSGNLARSRSLMFARAVGLDCVDCGDREE
jgi:hypothetical protein